MEILEAALVKPEGEGSEMYIIDCYLKTYSGRYSKAFKVCVDTGAAISCIPIDIVKPLLPLPQGRPVRIGGFDGEVKRARTYMVGLSLNPHQGSLMFYPKWGVLLRNHLHGLLGMDILNLFDIDFRSQGCTLKLRK